MDTKNLKLKYTMQPKGIIYYYLLLFTDMGVMLLKKIPALNMGYSGIFNHVTNFGITSILMAVVCFIWILLGADFKLVIWLAAVAIVLNFIVELFVTFLNTPDIVDAYYGAAGAIVTMFVMLLIQRTALKPAEN